MSKKDNGKKFVKAIKKEDLMDYTVEERERVAKEMVSVGGEATKDLVNLEKETIDELFFGEGRPVKETFDRLVEDRKRGEAPVESIFEPDNLKNALEYIEGIGYVANKRKSAYRYLVLGLKAISQRMSELGDDISIGDAFVIYSASNMLIESVNDKLEEVKNKQYQKEEILISEKDIERNIKLNRLEEKFKNGELVSGESVEDLISAFKDLANEIIKEDTDVDSEEAEVEEENTDNEVVDVPINELRTDDKILMRIVFGENTDCTDGSHYGVVANTLVDSVNGGFKKVNSIKDSSMNVIVNNLVRYFRNYSNEIDKDDKESASLVTNKYKSILQDLFSETDLKKLINDTLASYDKIENKPSAFNDRLSHYECAVVTSVYLAINTYVLVKLAKIEADRHIKGIEYNPDESSDDVSFRIIRVNNALLSRFNLLTNWEYRNINNMNIADGLDRAVTVSLAQSYLYTILNRLIRDDNIKDEDVAYLGSVLMVEFYLDRGAKTEFIVEGIESNLENIPLRVVKKSLKEQANMSVQLVGDLPVILSNLVSKEYIESLLKKVDLSFRRVDNDDDRINSKEFEEATEKLRNTNPLTRKGIPVNERIELVEEKYLTQDGKRDIFYHLVTRVSKEYYDKNKQYFISENNGLGELNIIKVLDTKVLRGITLMKLPIVTKRSLKIKETGEEKVEIGVFVQATALDRFMRAKFFASDDPVEWSISFMGDRNINYYRALAEHVLIDDSKTPYVLNAKLVKFYDDNENLGSVEIFNGDSSDTTGTRLTLHNDAFFLGTEEDFEKDYNTFISPIPKDIIQKMVEDNQDIKNSANNVDVTDDFATKDVAELLEALKDKLGLNPSEFDKPTHLNLNDDDDDDENKGGKVN